RAARSRGQGASRLTAAWVLRRIGAPSFRPALRPRSPLTPMLTSRLHFSAFRFPLPASVLPLLLAGCVLKSADKETTADTTHLAPVVTVTPVNRGTAGMAEGVSWAFSPDRKSVLVVADPGGVENEPVPNGFFFGDETRGFQTQMDSVWDVQPSPDWKWIGFGRAYTVVRGEGTGTDLIADAARRMS